MFKQIGRDRCPGRERAAMTRVVVGTAARGIRFEQAVVAVAGDVSNEPA